MEANNTGQIQADKLSLLSKIFYFLLSIYYLLNLIGSPALKFLFPIVLILACICVLIEKSYILSLCPVMAMIFIIGQGKILWSYHPIFHIAFDYLLLLFIFKVFIRRKSIFQLNSVPLALIIPISLHILWYIFQLFNIYNVGFIGTLAAGRVYILPLVFFLSVLNVPFEEEKHHFSALSKVVLFSFFFVSLIALTQHYQGQDFLSFAPYYKVVMGEAFIDNFFRPFSTTELPGGFGIYFTVFAAFIFISRLSFKLQFLFATFIVPLTVFTSILSQVRSAYLKYFFILSLTFIVVTISRKLTPLSLVKKFIPGSLVIFLLITSSTDFFSTFNLENSLMRFSSLFDQKVISQSRSGPEVILEVISKRLWENPFGLGPGRTGAAAGFSKQQILNDPVYGMEASWAFDNLFVSLATDLGLGMVFYLFIIFIILYYLLRSSLVFLKNDNRQSYQTLSVCFITCLILFLGNWGAIGLPYNPESFSFWLLSGIGLRLGLIYQTK